jgi:very-short-patch-repair endonuclease
LSDTPREKRRRQRPAILANARENRRALTPAETRLWSALRARQLNGLKFTKQFVLGPYIADFACRSARLAIELDGDSHAGREAYDARREAFFTGQGYRTLRFWNAEIFDNLDGVLRDIEQACTAPPSPNPSLIGRGQPNTTPHPRREGPGEGRRHTSRTGAGEDK